MRKSTAVCVAIMATSFALSIVCLFVSLGFYALSGTKEVAERIYTGEWDDIPESLTLLMPMAQALRSIFRASISSRMILE